MTDDHNILGHGIHIVGGGLTGYAAALALAQADFPQHLSHHREDLTH